MNYTADWTPGNSDIFSIKHLYPHVYSWHLQLFLVIQSPNHKCDSVVSSHLVELQGVVSEWAMRGCIIQALSTKQSTSLHFLLSSTQTSCSLSSARRFYLESLWSIPRAHCEAEPGLHEWVAQSISTALVWIIHCFFAAFVCQRHCGDESRDSQHREAVWVIWGHRDQKGTAKLEQ